MSDDVVASLQIICSGGRVFIGTDLSTFTAYIYRIRGYTSANVPTMDSHVYHATDRNLRPDGSGQRNFNWRTFGSDELPAIWGGPAQ
jgi:hypothetical protein